MFHMQKPPLGARLNTGHPLTNGLIGCWLFNEGGGNRVYNYALQKSDPIVGTVDWEGDGFNFGDTAKYVDLDYLAPYIASSGQGTMLIWWTPKNVSTSTQVIMSMREGVGDRYFLINHYGTFAFGWDDSYNIPTGVNFGLGRKAFVGMAWLDSGTCRVYHDGVHVASDSGAINAPTLAVIGGVANDRVVRQQDISAPHEQATAQTRVAGAGRVAPHRVASQARLALVQAQAAAPALVAGGCHVATQQKGL